MTEMTSSSQSASDQLAAAQKAQAELNAKIEALLTQTREEDLATVKRLITTLSFRAFCQAGICGSCGMRVNGISKLACTSQDGMNSINAASPE